MNQTVQDALDSVPLDKVSGTHGACCEIDAMNKILNAGEDTVGAKMGTVIDNITGKPKEPCSSCQHVMEVLGVE